MGIIANKYASLRLQQLLQEKVAIIPFSGANAAVNAVANSARQSSLLQPLYEIASGASARDGLKGLQTVPAGRGFFYSSLMSQLLDPLMTSEDIGYQLRNVIEQAPSEARPALAAKLETTIKNLTKEQLAALPQELRTSMRGFQRLANKGKIVKTLAEPMRHRAVENIAPKLQKHLGYLLGGFGSLGLYDPTSPAAAYIYEGVKTLPGKTIYNIIAGKKDKMQQLGLGLLEGLATEPTKASQAVSGVARKVLSPAGVSAFQTANSMREAVNTAENVSKSIGGITGLLPPEYQFALRSMAEDAAANATPVTKELSTLIHNPSTKGVGELAASLGKQLPANTRFDRALRFVGKNIGKLKIK